MSELVDRLNAALQGRYIVERRLGEGGMATVYLADDLKHDRKVALKVVKPDLAAQVGVSRFLAEIKTTAQLQHPHILPLFDSGEAGGFVYYVMPYVEGGSLRDRLEREGALPLDDAVQISLAVCRALEHAHARGVIHRDIKPENILFQDGEPIVADFGIALALDRGGGTRLTGTGMAIGSVMYMSPEQALSDGEIDGRADVYALGCVLHEMLAGEAPFGRGSAQAILARKISGRAPDRTGALDSVPGTVLDVIERALAADPQDRFATPGEVTATLSRALTQEAIERRAAKLRRVRVLRGSGVAALISLVAWISWWSVTSSGPASITRLSVLPPLSTLNLPGQEPLLQGLHSGLINELSRAGVTVIGGVQSMMRYRDSDLTVRDIAAELRVDAVVEWGGFWAGDSVGFDVRLVDGNTEDVLWTQSYGGTTDEIIGLYRSATAAIATEIHLALTPEARARLAETQPVDAEAQEAYMRAQFHWNRMTPEDFDVALEYLDVALAEDPNSAEAYAGKAWIRVAQQQLGILPPEEATPLAVAASDTALRLDSESPDVQYARGVVGWATWNWEEAEAGYRRAIELNPNLARARGDYSHFLAIAERPDEAMAQIDKAVEIEPLNLQLMAFRGMVLYFNRRYEEVIEQMLRVLDLVPNNRVGLNAMWLAHVGLGQEKEAVDYAARFLTATGLPEVADVLMPAYEEAGYREAFSRASGVIEELARNRFVAPMLVARVHWHAGRVAETLDWLERSVEAREPNSPYLGILSEFESLKAEPRFQALLEKIGLRGLMMSETQSGGPSGMELLPTQ